MITAADLRSLSSRDDLARLVNRLAFESDLSPVDLKEWKNAGILVDVLPRDASVYHLAVLNRLTLFFVESPSVELSALQSLLRSFRSLDPIQKIVLFAAPSDLSRLTIADLDGRCHLRRLDVDCRNPRGYAVDRLNLLARSADEISFEALERNFERVLGRESVARHFFTRFRESVRRVSTEIARLAPDAPADQTDAESLLLLSRILFLYFVQQKGWLDGNRRFFLDHLEDDESRGRRFFDATLTPLFFGCLNTPRGRRDLPARAFGTIPYLNGGLFEQSAFEIRQSHLSLPNELMRLILEETFERFAFSLDESDRSGAQIDPEMLGNVFEALMACDERLRSGSYYTPRALVETLVAEAISEYCSNGSGDLRSRLLAIARGASEPLPEADAASVRGALEELTVLDPACGSGAFLVVALEIIERLFEASGEPASGRSARRRGIVEQSLYGVDLKPEAVRLCELRLWLAIVAASDMPVDEVPPLPNLDRNVMQGNSLLGPLDAFSAGRLEIYRDWSYALIARRRLQEEYRTAAAGQKPMLARAIRLFDLRLAAAMVERTIEADVAELAAGERQRSLLPAESEESHDAMKIGERIAASRELLHRLEDGELDFFSYDVHFAPILASGGFSVVTGNPPWVRTSRIDDAARRIYADRYEFFGGRQRAFAQPDLALLFVERSLALARPLGVVSMLLPAKIASAAYASALRAAVMRRHRLVALRDWTGEARKYFRADTFPLGIVLQRDASALDGALTTVSKSGAEQFSLPISELSSGLPGSPWVLASRRASRLLSRIRSELPALSVVLGRTPVMGVKTGGNERFFLLDVRRSAEGVLSSGLPGTIPKEAICRTVRGRDVERWRLRSAAWMLWTLRVDFDRPPDWLKRIAAHRGVEPRAFRLSYVRPEHLATKVVWKDVARRLEAIVLPPTAAVSGLDFPLIPNQTTYCLEAITPDEAFVLAAMLNSPVVSALAMSIAEPAKDRHFRFFGSTLAQIPLAWPEQGSDSWRTLVRAGRESHQTGRHDREIDELVSSLYQITPGEAKILTSEWPVLAQ